MTDERAKELVHILRHNTTAWGLVAKAAQEAAEELERLREALRPFAAIAKQIQAANTRRGREFYADDLVTYDLVPEMEPATLRLSDCKRADELLK